MQADLEDNNGSLRMLKLFVMVGNIWNRTTIKTNHLQNP